MNLLFSMANNDLNQIRIFVQVAHLRSFTRAADSLGIEKSTVSQKVAQLETRLNTRLFHRTTRSVSLTEAGQQYLRYCESALETLEAGDVFLQDIHRTPKGKLRVCAPYNYIEFVMDSVVKPFLEAYPDVQLEVVQASDMPNLIDEQFDMAIVSSTNEIDDSNLIFRKIYETDWVWVASPAHVERYGAARSVVDLREQPYLAFINDKGLLEHASQVLKTGFRTLPSPRLALNNMVAVKAAIVNGLGFAAMPIRTVLPNITEGQLVQIATEVSIPPTSLYVVYPSRAGQPANVRAFKDKIFEWAQTMPQS